MKEFGIYTFAFKKAAPKSAITAYTGDDTTKNDFMVGEVDLTSKSYVGLSLEDACKQRITKELAAKHGLSYFDFDDIIDLRCYRVISDKTSHIDTDFRHFIESYILGTSIVEGTTEVVHNISRQELDEAIQNFAAGDTDVYRVNDFELYSYQKALEQDALDWLKDHDRCLYHLSTRGGKSYLSLDTALRDGAENILILTPFPAAQQSFADIAKLHKKFTGWKFYTKDDIAEDTIFNEKHNVILLSWQIFDEAVSKPKIKNIFDQIKVTHAIIDETHHTASSDRSENIVNILNDSEDDEYAAELSAVTEDAVAAIETLVSDMKQIHLSGTPYNDILSARFSKEEAFTFDFIDMIKHDKKTKEVGFPNLTVWNVCNMSTLNKLLLKANPSVFDSDEGFTLKKAFATKQRTHATIDFIFDNAFNPEESDTFDGTEDVRLAFDGQKNKHVLMFVPSVQAASWAAKYLQDKLPTSTNPVLRKYKVLGVSGKTEAGNNIDTSDKRFGLEKIVNNFEESNEYTIIITCLKLTTGVTLKKTDSILLLRNCSSAETFIQILFRIMTPDKNKTEANLYCFDSNISLTVVKETLRIRQERDDNTDIEHIKELFGVINFKKFWAHDGFEFDLNKADEWLKAVRDIPVSLNLLKMFSTAALSCMIPNLTDTQKEALLSLDALKTGITTREIAKGVCDGIKQKNYKKSSDTSGSYETSDVEKLLARLETLFAHLDWAIINNDITDVDDLINNFHVKLDGNTPIIVRNI